MNYFINSIFLLLPLYISCQNLPVSDLKKKGISQEELDRTTSLNGINGDNDYHLIMRQKNVSLHPNFKMFINNYELYLPSGQLVPLTNHKDKQTDIIYFEFIGKEILLVQKIFGPRRQIRISKFNITTAKSKVEFNVEIPCKFENECEWLIPKEKKLAFFTNYEPNEKLEHNSIYEYNWETNEMRLIFGKLPPSSDAATGRNFNLKDVKFNKTKNEFEYDY